MSLPLPTGAPLVDVLTVAQRVLVQDLGDRLADEGATVDQWRALRTIAAARRCSSSRAASSGEAATIASTSACRSTSSLHPPSRSRTGRPCAAPCPGARAERCVGAARRGNTRHPERGAPMSETDESTQARQPQPVEPEPVEPEDSDDPVGDHVVNEGM